MRRSGISFILALAGLICSSCAVESDMDIGNIPHVNGRITDLDDNPLEHIKVTFEWGAGTEPSVVYTSSEGMFSTSFIECWDTGGGMTVTVTIEDIDGEENGGLFERRSDKLMIYREDFSEEPVRIELDYRLTPATASESSPQA